MRRSASIGTVAALIALALPAAASADVDDLLVDTTSDNVTLDDCTAVAADCSLAGAFVRADDSDSGGETDAIGFDAAIFNGTAASATIVLADPLETSEPLDLGLDCALDKPCVGVDGSSTGGNAISVTGGPFAMRGLAIFDAISQGLFLGSGADDVRVENSWFGLELNGTVNGNGRGLNVTGDTVRIGGADPSKRNYFAGNGIGLEVFAGASNTTIKGNVFGVRPNNAVAGNSEADIKLEGNLAGVGPSDVQIGAEPDETLRCDGACNVIGATGGGLSTGVDLFGNDIATSTASDVEILGNHIGVRGGGDTPIGDAGTLVHLGLADSVTVAQNRLAGGVEGISTEFGATDISIDDNAIGLNLAEDAVISGPSGTAVIAQSSADGPVKVKDNRIARSTPGVGVITFDTGAVVSGNEIGLAGVAGSGGTDAIRSFGSEVQIKKNLLQEADTGIEVQGVDAQIGSGDADGANEINNIVNDAIVILGSANNDELGVNLGSGAGGIFVDLVGIDGPGNGAGGPNDEIEAPAINKAEREKVKGDSEDKATILIFKSDSAKDTTPSGLKKFLGETKADKDGKWKFKPDKKLDKGQVVTALQTDKDDSSSELAVGEKVK